MAVTDPTKTKAPKYKGTISLVGVSDEAPVTRSDVDLSQYEAIVGTSWKKHQEGHQSPAIGITLPSEAIATAQTHFRAAAKNLNVGVAFSTHAHDSKRGKELGLQPSQTRLVVQAKPRKVMPPRAPKTTDSTPAPAAKSSGLPAVKK